MTPNPPNSRGPIDFAGLVRGTAAEAAAAYTSARLRVVPIPHRQKKPVLAGWQKLRLSAEDLPGHFPPGMAMNIGVLLGEPSSGLLDVDGDCPEAVALMPEFLPPTDAVFGREGKASSHWLYQATGTAPRSTKFSDDDKTCLIELRGTGVQTVFPPSVHKDTGEDIRFEKLGVAGSVASDALLSAVQRVAAAALLSRRWRDGRHDTALALAGTLLKAGWPEGEVERFVGAVARAAGDEEFDDRLLAVRTTAEHHRAGHPVTGRAKLVELNGKEAVARLAKWLGLGREESGGRRPAKRGRYRATPGGIVVDYETAHGVEERPLTNFTAAIVGEVVEDDGAEMMRHVELRCELRGRETHCRMPIASFSSMGWPVERLGPGAIVEAGMGARDQARAAIQHLSDPDISRTTVYLHTGWRSIEGVGWAYLHAGGAIGPVGPVLSVETRLETSLALFRLPDPPDAEELVTAVRASLGSARLAPPQVGVAAYASIWRGVLGGTDFGVFVVGPTGAFKSELSALLQQHLGAGMDRLHLPGAWCSTDNALEDLLFRAKDTLLVIDDFKPTGVARDDARLDARADRVFRGSGNHAGRQRMRADTTLRPTRPPRALPMSTGEELPRGHSLRARLLALEVGAGDIDPAELAACQRDAADGLYAQATAAFIQWVAARYELVQERLRRRTLELRDEIDGTHRRTPANVAALVAALEIFLSFVADATGEECLTGRERDELLGDWRAALMATAAAQAAVHEEVDPVRLYLEALISAISSGRAHVADRQGGAPPEAEAWGWRPGGAMPDWRPQGDRVGWIDGEHLHLDPRAAFRAAQEMCGPGLSIPVGEGRLRKLLNERGLLSKRDSRRGRLLVRETLQGVRREVLCIPTSLLGEPAQPPQSDHRKPPGLTVERSVGRSGAPQTANRPTNRPTNRPRGASEPEPWADGEGWAGAPALGHGGRAES